VTAIVRSMPPVRLVVSLLASAAILSGCTVKPPRVTVGSIYSVDFKIDAWPEPGRGAPCFAARQNLLRYKALERDTSTKAIDASDAIEANYAIFLQPGDKVVVLATSADQSELELKRLSTGGVCYAMNEGAGQGLGLFGPCTHLGVFDWRIPTQKCDK
jgi:hypothetical protein